MVQGKRSGLIFGLVFGLLLPTIVSIPSATAQIAPKIIPKETGDSLLVDGWKQNKKGDYQGAIDTWRKALDIFRLRQDKSGQARILIALGFGYHDLSDFSLSLESYSNAIELYRDLNDQKNIAKVLYQKSLLYIRLKQYADSILVGKQSLVIYENLKDNAGRASALHSLGFAYLYANDYLQSLQHYTESIRIYRSLQDYSKIASISSDLGILYQYLADYSKSIESYKFALSYYHERKDGFRESSILIYKLAGIYNKLGQKKRADEYYQKAINILLDSIPSTEPEKAKYFAQISFAYSQIKNYGKSYEFNQKAFLIYKKLNDQDNQLTMLQQLGFDLTLQNKYDGAIAVYNQALEINRKIYKRENGSLLRSIAYVYQAKKNEPQKAIDYYKQAIASYKGIETQDDQAYIFGQIGRVYDSILKYDEAIEAFQQAALKYRSINNQEDEAQCLGEVARILSKQKRLDQSIAYYKQAVNIYETIRLSISQLPRSEQEIYNQTIAGNYRNLAKLLIQQNRLSEAQQVLELLKIRELKELNPDQKSNSPVRKISISATEKQHIIPEIANTIKVESEQAIDRLSPTNSLNQSAQLLLKLNSALIYQLLTEDKLWIILITTDGKLQRFSSTQTKKQIETLAQETRNQLEQCERSTCDKNDTQKLNQTTQILYQQLFPNDLQTTLQQSSIKHLTFALDSSLRNIPIAALYTGKQYLIEQYTISSIISAQLTDSQDRIPANPAQSSILAVGTSKSAKIEVPDFIDRSLQDRFTGLTNIPIELDAIVKSDRNPNAFPGKQLLDNDFTLTNIQTNLPNHSILHIASHGIFRPNFLDYSYILLGNQQRWSISALDQNAQAFQNIHLITLSACQTGLGGRDKSGIEIAGMSHAFLSKGAKAINASLWQIDDASTAMLMQQFYRNLTKNQTKAQALQTAQLHLLRTPRSQLETELSRSIVNARLKFDDSPNKSNSPPKPPDYTHPYYWAAFTLIGNSQ